MLQKIKSIVGNMFFQGNGSSPFSVDLNGKVIVITGASRGVGKAIAEVLSKKGASVALIARNISKNDLPNALVLEGDIGSDKDVQSMIQKVIARFGKIDVLINNAGIFNDKSLDTTTSDEYDAIFNTNVKGTYLITREVIPYMKKQKSGSIFNIGSKISHNTNVSPNKVLYAATKYAIEGFSYALNKELKPHGIRVICLMPGTINTFLSLKSNEYLSSSEVANLILTLIQFEHIDFEGIVFKSIRQNI